MSMELQPITFSAVEEGKKKKTAQKKLLSIKMI